MRPLNLISLLPSLFFSANEAAAAPPDFMGLDDFAGGRRFGGNPGLDVEQAPPDEQRGNAARRDRPLLTPAKRGLKGIPPPFSGEMLDTSGCSWGN